MYVEDESNEDSKDNSVVDVNTKGPLKEEDEQIDEDATEIEEAYKVDEDATEIEDAYKIDEDATDAEDANEIDDGKTEGIPDEMKKYKRLSLISRGSTKKSTATWVVTRWCSSF